MKPSIISKDVKENLQHLNLRQFFGGYKAFDFDPEFFYLGIGEVAGVPLRKAINEILIEFFQSRDLSDRVTRYGGTRGELEANELISKHLNQVIGKEVFTEKDVICYSGAHNGINVLIRTCTAPLGSSEDKKQYILVAAPAYPYFSTIANAHRGVIVIPAFNAEQLVEGIEENMNDRVGVILINVPNNPLGYTLTESQVKRINQIAEQYHAAIGVDMVYAMNTQKPDVMKAIGQFDLERTIIIDSFSKKYGLPGARIGFGATANEEAIEGLRMIKSAESIGVSHIMLLFAAHMFQHYADYPGIIAEEIKKRYAKFYETIGNLRPYGIEIPPNNGTGNTFYVPLFVKEFCQKTGLTVEEFGEICRDQYKIIVTPGSRMYPPAFLKKGKMVYPGDGPPEGMQISDPQVVEDGAVIYASQFEEKVIPFVRLSFGVEPRIEEASKKLTQAVAETYEKFSFDR